MRHEREAKALTKVLEPYRYGPQRELRTRVRCMLVTLMGFASCDAIPVGIRKIPHWFPRRSGLSPEELADLRAVAHDGLLELGYDAAADIVNDYGRGFIGVEVSAKEALENLESGPPSVMVDHHPIVKKTIRTIDKGDRGAYLVGRNVNDPTWWYRFIKGKAVHDQRGRWVGWDRDVGYTFQRRGRTLDDVLAGLYGSLDLR